MTRRLCAIFVLFIIAVASSVSSASFSAAGSSIGIKFVGTGTAMGAAETAGVVPMARWNNATTRQRTTPLALVDDTGAASGATVTWTAYGIYSTPTADDPGNRRLMRGYLDTSDTSVTTVTVAGLADAAYDVYVYVDGDNLNLAKTAAYRISGAGITTTTINLTDAANTNFNTTFTQANNSNGNYVKFSIAATGFTLTATPGASPGNKRAPVNAIQIVSTTPPSPDFTIAATPASRTVTQGGAAAYTVTTTALGGFTGPVALSVTGLPANATATFTPASVNGAGTATLDIATAANTPSGTSTLTITGTSGSLTHTTTATLIVNPAPVPDFAVSATPAARTVTVGNGTSYSVTVSAINGFTGPVTLSASGLPANAGATFTPASVNGAGTSTLAITTAGNTPTGTSTLTITGTSGSISRTATVDLTVNPPPDFTIAASPGSQTVFQGSSTTYTVTTGALSGFNGTVTLSATGLPANASASFSPASITGAGSATLTVTTTAGTPTGTSSISITGISGSLNHSATANLVVNAAPAGRSVGIHFVGTGTAMGATESAGVVPMTNWNNATGASRATPLALVDSTGVSSGATVTWSSNNTWRMPITDQPGNRRLMWGYLDTSDTSVTTVTVANLPNAAYDVYVYADGDNLNIAKTAAYRISGTGITTTTINLTDAANTNFNAAFTPANNSNGNYVKFSITASGFTLTATPGASSGNKRAPVNAVQIVPTTPPSPDFTIASTPSSRTVTQGGGTTYTVSTTALNGFTDPVALAVTGLPANATATFTPPSIDGAGTGTLNVTTAANTPPGTATLTITGTSGSLTHTATATLVVNATPVPDFAVSATPAARTVTRGNGTSYAVTVSALNGFAGPVTLSATGLPANATATFTPASVDGAGTSTLAVSTAVNTPTGTSTLTITGTSGGATRSASVSLTINAPTYAISGSITPAADGAGASMTLGGAAAATATADAQGDYSFSGLANGSYVITPAKNGFVFSPASRNVTISDANMTAVDFTAIQSANTISMSAPANGATVSSAFSMSANTSAGIVRVQFQIDGANVGPEDTSAPFSVSVTAANGSHSLRAIGRDASGNSVTSASINVTVSGGSGTALAINGSQTFQTMDGFGVNINSLSWMNGQLAPALDRLVDEAGVKIWRVVFDMGDWESTNDNADPNTPNWAYYNALYSNAKFQNLWGTLHYLNQKGVTSGIMISFMGRVPPWMGGPKITNSATMEDEWVETVATLLFYARNTENVQFDLLDPINEPDWDGFEGPQVDQWQYPRLMQKLSLKLDAMGLGDIRFVGPNTAQVTTGVDAYLPELFANSTVMNKLDHFGFHNYAGQTGGADAKIKSSPYPQKNFWLTELSIPEQIFTMIAQGAAAALIWDAYDSVYNHAIIAGQFYNDGRGTTPPNDAGNLPALMSYSSASGTYTARPQFYQMHTFRYVMPGSIRIGASESNSSLTVYAFRHAATGRVTIIGRNTGGSSITLSGSMSNVGSVGALQFYQTSISNNYNSFTRGSDAAVTGGAFIVTVAANSYFTLTSAGQ